MAESITATESLLAGCLSSTTAATARPRAWTPPDPQELAGVFPQLEVLELVGHGGMGAVYRARQTHLDRIVALKLLPPHLATASFRHRFRREGQILAGLKHPHIVAIHDVGETRGWQYLLMEYIDGASLRAVMTTGPFTASAVLRLADEILGALAYAHGRGVIHRDLKPENILLDPQGRALLVDFGLAKQAHEDPADDITRTGEVVGTMSYMAPEQRAGSSVDHRADLYAMGIILSELLTGSVPPAAPPPGFRRVAIDRRVDAILARARERTPELRWPTAAAMAAALAPVHPALRTPAPAWRRPHLWALCGAMVVGGIATGQVLARSAAHAAPVTDAAAVAATSATARPVHADVPLAPRSPPAVRTVPHPSAEGVHQDTRGAPATASAARIPPAAAAPALAPVPAAAPLPMPLHRTAAPVHDLQALAIDGSGELTVLIDPGLAPGTDVRTRLPEGIRIGPPPPRIAAGGSQPLAVTVEHAHQVLRVPPGIHWLRYLGSGALHVVDLQGEGLVLEHLGTGLLSVEHLRAQVLELRVGAVGITRIEGVIDRLQLAAVAPPPTPGSDGEEVTPGEIDASDLSVRHLAGQIDGGVRVRVAGHCRRLELAVGEGELLGADLTVDDAVVAITGSGQVLLGEVGRLDAHAPPGQLHARVHPQR